MSRIWQRFCLAFSLVVMALPALAQQPLPTMPANTLWGRLGTQGDFGPGSALPMSSVAAVLYPGLAPVSGPGSATVNNDGVCWHGTSGVSIQDCGFPPVRAPVSLANGGLGASQQSATVNQIPVYPGSGGSAVPTDLATLLANRGALVDASDLYFGSGRPQCDPRAHGATATAGGGNTDDSAAFLACRRILDALGGGDLKVSPGLYCLNTVDADFPSSHAAIAIESKTIRVIGSGGHGSTVLATCGSDVALIYANVNQTEIRSIELVGKGQNAVIGAPDTTFGATYPALWFGVNCGLCSVDMVNTYGGNDGIRQDGSDGFLQNYNINNSYGDWLHISGNGSRLAHGAHDNAWQIALPIPGSVNLTARANNTFYGASFTGTLAGSSLTVSGVTGTIAIGQLLTGSGVTGQGVQITAGSGLSWTVSNPNSVSAGPEAMTGIGIPVVTEQSYYWQLSQAGTSGGSPPNLNTAGSGSVPCNFGTDCVDGTAHWRAVGRVGCYNIRLDGGSGEISGHDLDIGGPCYGGIGMVNTNAVGNKGNHSFSRLTMGGTIAAAIDLEQGQGFSVDASHMTPGIQSGGYSILVSGTYSGNARIYDNFFFQAGSAAIFLVNGTSGYTINGNVITGATTGLLVNAGIGNFVFTGNVSSTSNCYVVTAGGSDYYNISNNVCNGNAMTDGGTGVHKTIMGNN